jgi:hypothetical protein
MRHALWLVLAALFAAAIHAQAVRAAEPPRVERYLTEGRLADGQRELAGYLKENPADDQARFGLGTLQFVRSVEHLAQTLYQFGAVGPKSRLTQQIPFLRIAVPENPAPDKVRYADVRRMLQNLLDDLTVAEKTLAEIKDEKVKLPLHFGLIRLDVNGDGQTADSEVLWKIYAELNRGIRLGEEFAPEHAEAFTIVFDYGDVHWLRGYCHLLSATCEAVLAYDQQDLFNAVAHQLFDRPDVPALPREIFIGRDANNPWMDDIADAIAGIHLSRFPLKEPERMKASLAHLEAVIDHSRQSWKAIQAEKDDDREWIPNSKQTGVIPGVRVSAEIIAGWHEFLDEAEKLLSGKKLIPHWRFNARYGINLRRVFLEPRELDVVLWAHGSAAAPYAEEGPVVTRETWNRMGSMFGGQFIGFAFWFN